MPVPGVAAGYLLAPPAWKMIYNVSTPDLSDTRAEVDSPSGPAATRLALRRATGHVDEPESGLSAAGAKGVVKLAGAATGHVGASRAANARMVAETIESTYTRQAAQAASRSSFLQETAARVQAAAEKAAKAGTRAGGREHLKGHFIERLDVSTYNAKNRLTGKIIDSRPNPINPAYDASRYIKGKFAGGVQQKSSAAGTEKAIAQIEKVKAGSVRRATLRVPKDQAAKARARAGWRIRVSEMEFTSAQAGKKLDRGVGDLAKRGAKATSTARAVGRGASSGAAVNVALGAAGDGRAFKRGDISGRDFAENRAVDAAEGAANAVVGMGAMAAGGMAATAALGTSAGAAVAASAGAAGTAALGAVGGMGAAGAAAAGVLGGVTVAAAAPFVVGTTAAIATGVVVSKGFTRVRNGVRAHQHRRRAHAFDQSALALPAAELDENGAPITDAVIVEVEQITRSG
jgi:HEPN domain-containing protein